MIRMTFITLLALLCAFGIYVAVYTGYFKPVTVSQGLAGPFRLLGKSHIGAYHKIVPVIEEVEAWAKSQGIDCRLSFGFYLDDPERVEQLRLKSRGGCVLTGETQVPNNLPEGMTIENLGTNEFVIAKFEGSPGIGPFKAYPAALEYFEENRLAFKGWNVLETYEVKGPKDVQTTYYFPISR